MRVLNGGHVSLWLVEQDINLFARHQSLSLIFNSIREFYLVAHLCHFYSVDGDVPVFYQLISLPACAYAAVGYVFVQPYRFFGSLPGSLLHVSLLSSCNSSGSWPHVSLPDARIFSAAGLTFLFLTPASFSAAGLSDLLFGGIAGTFSIVILFQGANLQLITGFLPELFCTFADVKEYSGMALIKSISGIRGTIGGNPGESLTPIDIVKFASAYGTWLRRRGRGPLKVVTGRDARVSGEMVASLVNASLRSVGIDVVDAGLVTTPTVEMAVTGLKAGGGIIFTASHNPAQWNALKLLNEAGEFLSDSDGREVLALAEATDFEYVTYDKLGSQSADHSWTERHIQAVIDMPLVDREAIRVAGLTVAVDAVNSVGGLVIPVLLEALGVQRVIKLYCEPTGLFPHNPEPLPEHLGKISQRSEGAGRRPGVCS